MWASISTTGNWQGEIWNRRKNGECYPERLTITAIRDDESGEISNYAGIFSDLSQSKFNEERIKQLAFYDHLTGLPNRRLLIDRMQHAMSNRDHSAEHMAVMFIDLDNFKVLNDSKGHAVGDQLLKEIARRLVACVREQDTIARLGGDEFVVLIEGMSKNLVQAITEMQAVAAKILKAVSRPYLLGEHTCFPSCSIGVSLFHDHESTIDSILKQADTAMYAAKKQGGDNVRLFNPHMQTALENRVRLEADLRIAIAEQQFVLHYQVQVKRLNKIVVTGAEVLLRWNHPTLGAISPAQFIPVAEEAGLIIPIGNWVIETVCQRLKLWQADELTRELILSVNVSAIQLRQSDFVSQVVEAIQRHAINPVKLKLELTESMLLDNIEEIITKMTVLKNLGVQFSLDDFGTGYSSLQYLKRLPLSQLKVDQSFVRDIHQSTHDRSIVRTIIAMAEGLDLEAIAEGVETEEQQLSLVRKGCNHFQGYFFGKPLPVEQFEASLVCND
jgi:diguanylate cyclase (GGDEF)-like protein